MGNPVLKERYELLCRTPSDVQLWLPHFVQTVEELDATKVIELGVRYGCSALAWLYALEDRGHLWAVDCSFPVPGPEVPGVNLLDPQGPLGVLRHFHFVLGYCEWPETMAALPDQVDVVFLDCNHGYRETLEQLDLYLPRVRPGGRLLLHDTDLLENLGALEPEPKYPVRTAMEEFCAEMELECSSDPRCSGLGTILVP